jgi:Fic family protein
MRETGIYKSLGDLKYFIPHDLPPKNPAFELDVKLTILYGEATFALGQLNEMSKRLPDQDRFIKAYVIKEALLSSAIENVHTTLADVLTYDESESKPDKDTQLVLNYTKALDAALTMIESQNLPIVSRVILKAHEVLMSAGKGDKSAPGNYRQQTVRVGELVPPPPTDIPNLMRDLEKYINESSDELPDLIKAGLVHAQFETIHPFLDGNGRIGRLLIVLMLINSGMLHLPILYPSYYFKKYRLEYYASLDRVRTEGDFEGWITYYLKVIRDSALDAYKRAKEIEELENNLKTMIQNDAELTHKNANEVLNLLFMQPITGVSSISEKSGKAYNTVNNILKRFVELKIVSVDMTQKRNKLYRFEPYLALLEKEY